jgi:diguanylate cyclase (GGDEF)-like protein
MTTCVFLLDRGEGVLEAAHVGGKFAPEMRKLRLDLGKGISGWAAAYQRSIVNTGPSLDFKWLEGDFKSLTDALVVPLLHGGGAIGTISLYAEHPIFYSRAHLALIEMVARQAAPLLAEALQGKASKPDAALVDPTTQAHRASYLPVAAARMIADTEAAQSSFSLFYLECKSATQVSKLYGASATDAFVRRVADALREELRDTDVLVRFGLDSFVMLLAAVRGEQAPGRAARLQQLARGVSPAPAGRSLGMQCPIGHASYPDDGTDVFTLLEAAQRQTAEAAGAREASASDLGGSVVEFPPQA